MVCSFLFCSVFGFGIGNTGIVKGVSVGLFVPTKLVFFYPLLVFKIFSLTLVFSNLIVMYLWYDFKCLLLGVCCFLKSLAIIALNIFLFRFSQFSPLFWNLQLHLLDVAWPCPKAHEGFSQLLETFFFDPWSPGTFLRKLWNASQNCQGSKRKESIYPFISRLSIHEYKIIPMGVSHCSVALSNDCKNLH